MRGLDQMGSRARVARAALALWARPWVTNTVGHRVYVDRSDHRAWQMRSAGGALDRDAVAVWRQLVDACDPDLVLDIGANYGEVVLSSHYRGGAAIHVFEPNGRLTPHLRRSLTEAGLDATVHEVAVTPEVGTSILNIDGRSSGLSSLEPGAHRTRQVEIRTAPIDALIEGRHASCVFKIDVEGSEAGVWASMTDTLAGCDRWAGLVEYRYGSSETVGSRPPFVEASRVPYRYVVRLPERNLEPATEAILEAVGRGDPGWSKDVVLASTPL